MALPTLQQIDHNAHLHLIEYPSNMFTFLFKLHTSQQFKTKIISWKISKVSLDIEIGYIIWGVYWSLYSVSNL